MVVCITFLPKYRKKHSYDRYVFCIAVSSTKGNTSSQYNRYTMLPVMIELYCSKPTMQTGEFSTMAPRFSWRRCARFGRNQVPPPSLCHASRLNIANGVRREPRRTFRDRKLAFENNKLCFVLVLSHAKSSESLVRCSFQKYAHPSPHPQRRRPRPNASLIVFLAHPRHHYLSVKRGEGVLASLISVKI